MAGRDLCGIAQTGTGKTAAFALPILHRLAEHRRASRRDAAAASSCSARPASSRARSPTASAPMAGTCRLVDRGGVRRRRRSASRSATLAGGVDILVATPGRLLDLIDRRALSPARRRDPRPRRGRPDARSRLHPCPEADREAAADGAPDAVLLGDHAEDDRVARRQRSCAIPRRSRCAPGRDHGRAGRAERHVRADGAASRRSSTTVLQRSGDRARPRLHPHQARRRQGRARACERAGIDGGGDPRQQEPAAARAGARRLQVPARCRVLVATDIAARGIDVDGVTHVDQLRPAERRRNPTSTASAARPGRARPGIAISFCNGEERAYLRDIEKLTRLKVPVAPNCRRASRRCRRSPRRAEPRTTAPAAPQQQRQGQRPAQGQGRGRRRAGAPQGQGNGNGRSQGNGHGRGQGQGNGHGNGSDNGRAPERQQEAGRPAAGSCSSAAAARPTATSAPPDKAMAARSAGFRTAPRARGNTTPHPRVSRSDDPRTLRHRGPRLDGMAGEARPSSRQHFHVGATSSCRGARRSRASKHARCRRCLGRVRPSRLAFGSHLRMSDLGGGPQ